MIRVDGQSYVKSQDVLRTLKTLKLLTLIISTKSLVLKNISILRDPLPPNMKDLET